MTVTHDASIRLQRPDAECSERLFDLVVLVSRVLVTTNLERTDLCPLASSVCAVGVKLASVTRRCNACAAVTVLLHCNSASTVWHETNARDENESHALRFKGRGNPSDDCLRERRLTM